MIVALQKGVDDFCKIYMKMKKDFDEVELKDFDVMQSLLQEGIYKLFILEDTKLKLEIGYAVVVQIIDEGVLWLDYLAVEENLRNNGYGSNFIKILQETTKSKNIFIEVEMPIEQVGKKREIQLRRINFYQKNNAKKVDIDYIYPSKTEEFPMFLFVIGEGDTSNNKLKNVIKYIFEKLHRDINNIELTLNKVLNSIIKN